MNGKHLVLGPDTLEEIVRRAHSLLDGKDFDLLTCSELMPNRLHPENVEPEPGDVEKEGIVVNGTSSSITFFMDYNCYGVLKISPQDKAEFYFAGDLMVISAEGPMGLATWVFSV